MIPLLTAVSYVSRHTATNVAADIAADVDADQIRSRFDEVLQRREFDYSESLFERFVGWLGRLVQRILESIRIPGTSAGSGTGFGSYVVLIVLIVAVMALVVVIIRRLRSRRPTTRDDADRPTSTMRVRANDDSGNWMDEYVDPAVTGSAKMAILSGYRRLVGVLVRNGLLDGSVGDSPREILDEVAASAPGSHDMVEEATEIFEGPWYGDELAQQDLADRLDEIASQMTGTGTW